jgi:hypothetical protein
MKKFFMIFLLLGLFSLTSCNGYNKKMRKHLSDENNYITINANYLRYEDLEGSMYIVIENDDSFKYPNGFDQAESNQSDIRLEIIGENYSVLKDVFINEDIKTGTNINLKCSTLIYMDTKFYYIAEINTTEQTYLTFEIGLKNIIDYIKNHKSIF